MPGDETMQQHHVDADSREDKRRTGVFYTPSEIAKFLSHASIARYLCYQTGIPLGECESFMDAKFPEKIPASMVALGSDVDKFLRNVKVLDPAAGNGAMLVAMLAELVAARIKIRSSIGSLPMSSMKELQVHVIKHCLHGIDIDAAAIASARERLARSTGAMDNDVPGVIHESLLRNLTHGNALRHRDHNQFDIIISNPPYLSFYSNSPSRPSEVDMAYYKKTYETIAARTSRVNAMNLFIEKGIKSLKENGMLAYVVNKTLCVLPSYNMTRAYILANTMIEQLVVDLDPFDAVVDCALIVLSNQVPPKEYSVRWSSLKGMPESQVSLSSRINKDITHVPIDAFLHHRLLEFSYSIHEMVLEKMERAPAKMIDIMSINRGVNIGGCSEHFLSPTLVNHEYGKIILNANNIESYCARWDEDQGYFIFDQETEQLLRSRGKTLVLGDPARYDQPRLFIPEASSVIKAALVEEPMYSAYGILVGTPKTSLEEIKLACALLNSRAVTFYAIERDILRKGKKATPHVGVKGLNALPVPRLSKEAVSRLISLGDEIMRLKQDPRYRHDEILASKARSLHASIDAEVFDLYQLDRADVQLIDTVVGSLFK